MATQLLANQLAHDILEIAEAPSNLVRGKRGKAGKRKKGKRPAFEEASKALGKSVHTIKKAIGPPPPPDDFSKAAKILGVDAAKLELLLFPKGR